MLSVSVSGNGSLYVRVRVERQPSEVVTEMCLCYNKERVSDKISTLGVRICICARILVFQNRAMSWQDCWERTKSFSSPSRLRKPELGTHSRL